MQSLAFLRLQKNRLGGRILVAFGILTSLQRVSLANNKLEGLVPSGIYLLLLRSTSMATDCQFRCQNRLESFVALCSLNVANNLLQGSFPTGLSSLSNLQSINISTSPVSLNGFPCFLLFPGFTLLVVASKEGCQKSWPRWRAGFVCQPFLGNIPSWLGGLSQLYLLNLPRNSLVSCIHETFISFKDFGGLDLHWNHLTSPLIKSSKMVAGSLVVHWHP